MSHGEESARRVIPAQLNFLAIYCPALGQREDNKHDQIVYYYGRKSRVSARKRSGDAAPDNDAIEHEKQEQSRQVGIAQGLLSFARGFANDAPLEFIETEKHSIVLVELETDWWILASIDLTRLPSSRQTTPSSPRYEFSARETSPPDLLKQQLLRAHRTFLLHNSHSLSNLYVHLTREKFCDSLEQYWTPFASSWDVLLHGNPAVETYAGIKLAAGGELGIGVGEEDWGSGEREVLEGLIRNTEGLLDLTVSRFGEPVAEASAASTAEAMAWLGNRRPANPSDGIIFSGIGKLSRTALRDVAQWVEDVFVCGDGAYGVESDPSSLRRKRRRRRPQPVHQDTDDRIRPSVKDTEEAPPLVLSTDDAVSRPAADPPSQIKKLDVRSYGVPDSDIPRPIVQDTTPPIRSPLDKAKVPDTETYSIATNTLGSPDAWKKVFTLGYGPAWGATRSDQRANSNGKPDTVQEPVPVAGKQQIQNAPEPHVQPRTLMSSKAELSRKPRCHLHSGRGHFLIGLTGDLDADNEHALGQSAKGEDANSWSGRLSLRTLHLTTRERRRLSTSSKGSADSQSSQPCTMDAEEPDAQGTKQRRLRVVVYGHRPFLYTLFFDPECPLLTYPSFFHDLHHHLTPLHGPLQRSTDPSTVLASLAASLPQPRATTRGSDQQIHTLIYSPSNNTIRSSIPNIPAPGTAAAEGIVHPAAAVLSEAHAWTRVEALSVHSRILDTYSETRAMRFDSVKRGERERTLKTGRGWWIVWLRVSTTSRTAKASTPTSASSVHSSQLNSDYKQNMRHHRDDEYKEAILIRRTADSSTAGGRKSSYRTMSPGGASSGWMQGMGSSALAPFSRWSGTAQDARRAGASAGPGAASTSEADSIGGIGVDARKYVEALLSLNR